MDPDLHGIAAAVTELGDAELHALIATANAVPQITPGLLAWLEHAADWELRRRAGVDFALQPPDAAIDPSEDAASLAAALMLRERRADEQRRHAEAARKAAELWQAGQPAGADHPYLTRKHVSPVASLRELDAAEAARILGYTPQARGAALAGRLLVAPIKIGSRLSSAELIDEAGRKAALAGGAKAGGYWAAQPLPSEADAADVVLIAEGIATALTAREATGHPALAALSCGNLTPLAAAMRRRYPRARLVILVDLGNGEAAAEQAAREAGALLAKPGFGTERPDGASDFNDLAALGGPEAVAASIGAILAGSSVAPDDDGVCIVRADDMSAERVRWLWRDYLPLGKLTIEAGPAGVSKTTLALAIGATITQAGRWPDGTRAESGDVLIWSGEYGIADTLLPRLIAHEADLRRVHFVGDVTANGERRPFPPRLLDTF